MAFNAETAPERMQWIADAMGSPQRPVSELLGEPIADLGMPTRLRDVGVETSHFDAIADGAMLNAFLRANIRPVSREDIIALLEKAY